MDAKNTIVTPWPKQGLSEHVRAAPTPVAPRPSREQAEAAVRTLIAFAGDDPDREGLLETPKRVIGAYEELYQGYRECPVEVLDRTFSETGGYDDFVLVKDISFNSHCEHHMMPFYGKAHVAYMVMIEAEHMCMSLRGVEKPGAMTVTTHFTGAFREDANEQVRFMTMLRGAQR